MPVRAPRPDASQADAQASAARSPASQAGAPSADANGRLPDFLIIGATKCGTTSLHSYLAAHPQVFMHPAKEIRYFTTEHNNHLGADWYRRQFAAARPDQVVGEASNAYSRDPVYAGAPERIAALLPGVRLVYVVREPFRRLQSHWRHRLVTGWEGRAAEGALRTDPSYLAASLYGRQLAAYRRHFPAARILVLQSEALFADPSPHLRRLADFLGIDHDPLLAFAAENVTAQRRQAPVALRQLSRLGPAYRDVVRAFVARMGQRLNTGPSASAAAYRISAELEAEIGRLLAADRSELVRLTGPELVAGWPKPRSAQRRTGRAPGAIEMLE